MSPMAVALIVCVFVVMGLVVIGAVFAMAGQAWREVAGPFPEAAVREGAVRKEFQAIKIGMMSFGGCLHIAADEDHLHLYPAWIMRKTMRARACSIPWSAIELRSGQKLKRRYLWVKIGGHEVLGPAWCFRLAAREFTTEDTEGTEKDQ